MAASSRGGSYLGSHSEEVECSEQAQAGENSLPRSDLLQLSSEEVVIVEEEEEI